MDWYRQDFEELSRILEANPHLQPALLEAMAASDDSASARNGFALLTAWHYRQNDCESARQVLDRAMTRFDPLPIPLFTLRQLLLFFLLKQRDPVPMEYLNYGFRLIEAGDDEPGVEAIGTAFVNDTHHTLDILHNPQLTLRAMEHFERAAERIIAAAPLTREASDRSKDRRLRVGMLVSNIVDHTVAFSRRILDFARFMDPTRYEYFVYSTENACSRRHELPVMYMSHTSAERAPLSLAELKARHVPVFIAPTDKPTRATAHLVAQQIARDDIDILIFQSGPHMPIDWLAARLAPTPVKIHLHIGACVYMRSMDVTLFDNALNMEREAAVWPQYAGERVLLRQGTDIDAIDRIPALSRTAFGIPSDAIAIGLLSNRFRERLTKDYIDIIIRALQTCPQAWFIAIGAGGCPGVVEQWLRDGGVWERVRFVPQQTQPGGALKMLDIYANEFPAGGSQSVVEAMVCGLPVISMRCGTTHHESAGADIVGAPYAIDTFDVSAYSRLLDSWVSDAALRRDVGRQLRRRAEQYYSIRDYVGAVCDMGAKLLSRKQPS